MNKKSNRLPYVKKEIVKKKPGFLLFELIISMLIFIFFIKSILFLHMTTFSLNKKIATRLQLLTQAQAILEEQTKKTAVNNQYSVIYETKTLTIQVQKAYSFLTYKIMHISQKKESLTIIG